MHIESIRAACLAKPGVTESLPFGDDTLVFKVGGKMFLLANLEGPLRLNLKALPDEVIDRIEHFASVMPGYHMNKKHWITVDVESLDNDALLMEWVDVSYQLILESLPAKIRTTLTF